MNFDLIFKFFTSSEYDTSRPTLGAVIGSNAALVAFITIIILAVEVGKYALGIKIYGKDKAYKAIIPVYGLMQLFKSVDLNPYLAIVSYIPVVGIIPFSIFSFYVPKAFGQKIDYQVLSIFAPYAIFNMLGFDPKYEFQYVKGKNVAFKDEFRTVMPEDLSGDALTPAAAVKGAAVSTMAAKESMVSRAASAAAEQTRIIREEQERVEQEEAKKQAEAEAAKKAAKQKTEDFNYNIFDNSTEAQSGPEAASLGIDFKMMNGRFQSAPVAKPTPKPAPAAPVVSAQTPAPTPKPAQPTPTPQTPPQPTPIPQTTPQPPKPVV